MLPTESGGVSPNELRTRAHLSGGEYSANWATAVRKQVSFASICHTAVIGSNNFERIQEVKLFLLPYSVGKRNLEKFTSELEIVVACASKTFFRTLTEYNSKINKYINKSFSNCQAKFPYLYGIQS